MFDFLPHHKSVNLIFIYHLITAYKFLGGCFLTPGYRTLCCLPPYLLPPCCLPSFCPPLGYLPYRLHLDTWLPATMFASTLLPSMLPTTQPLLKHWACIHSSLVPTRAFANKKPCVTNRSNFIYPYPLIAKFTVLKPPIIKLNSAFNWNMF